MAVLLYKTEDGLVAAVDGRYFRVPDGDWDSVLNTEGLLQHLQRLSRREKSVPAPRSLLAPVGSQEIWAAGVTYFRSRDARIEESREAGSADFYDRVYTAARPELFFKATPHRVAPPGGQLRIRRDSRWMVPEPELTLVINRHGTVIGFTVGNDLSCRDLEGENPLYLPQAKIFDQCVALGPGLLIQDEPLPPSTRIQMEIRRNGVSVSRGETALREMKRQPAQLVDYLTREASFPAGCLLLTGTGIVPDDGFTLETGDEVSITIEPIGTLVNTMALTPAASRQQSR
jgi:2-dehydro-3-deoxy-D-arabinonate dehydratase